MKCEAYFVISVITMGLFVDSAGRDHHDLVDGGSTSLSNCLGSWR